MEIYHVVEISSEPKNFEMLSGWLSALEIDSIEEQDALLLVYYRNAQIGHEEIKETLESLKLLFSLEYEIKEIENKNWNEEWEANFKAVEIDQRVSIRADFHSIPENIEFDIIINPKMAFGTAHHETTYMMIQQMLKQDMKGKKVLDYGCGTSILAILAEKMGAEKIVANDYDILSVENSAENISMNNCQKIEVRHGDLDKIVETDFDIILANINRNVLLTQSESIAQLLRPNGHLMMSGILETDQELILENYQAYFKHITTQQKGEWLCIEFRKSN